MDTSLQVDVPVRKLAEARRLLALEKPPPGDSSLVSIVAMRGEMLQCIGISWVLA